MTSPLFGDVLLEIKWVAVAGCCLGVGERALCVAGMEKPGQRGGKCVYGVSGPVPLPMTGTVRTVCG